MRFQHSQCPGYHATVTLSTWQMTRWPGSATLSSLPSWTWPCPRGILRQQDSVWPSCPLCHLVCSCLLSWQSSTPHWTPLPLLTGSKQLTVSGLSDSGHQTQYPSGPDIPMSVLAGKDIKYHNFSPFSYTRCLKKMFPCLFDIFFKFLQEDGIILSPTPLR